MNLKIFLSSLCFLLIGTTLASAEHVSEVIPKTDTAVVVREHPKTGRPYVSIVRRGQASVTYSFQEKGQEVSRPDYQMLNPNVRSGEIPYNGPVSDRKKVYALAASLAAGGILSGTLLPVTAASGAAASGGAGAYAAAGMGVASATAGAVAIPSQPDPHGDDFSRKSGSNLSDLYEAAKIQSADSEKKKSDG